MGTFIAWLIIIALGGVATVTWYRYHRSYRLEYGYAAVATTGLLLAVLLFTVAFTVFLTVMLVGVAAVALLGRLRHRRRRWRRMLLLGCTVAALLLGVANLAYHLGGCRTARLGRERLAVARGYVEVEMEYLGRHLVADGRRVRALVVHDRRDRLIQPRLAGLRRGLGRRGRIGEALAVDAPLTASAADALVAEHDGCNTVIFLTPLPVDVARVSFWAAADAPLTVVVLSRPGQYTDQLADGRIDVLVSPNPHGTSAFGDRLPQDLDTAFNARYQLETPPAASSQSKRTR